MIYRAELGNNNTPPHTVSYGVVWGEGEGDRRATEGDRSLLREGEVDHLDSLVITTNITNSKMNRQTLLTVTTLLLVLAIVKPALASVAASAISATIHVLAEDCRRKQ
jgi:hypothetical protein